MWQYDPQGVIKKMRTMVKLAHCAHYSLLEIERYANQAEWLENTLIDKASTIVDVENDLYDIEQQIDVSKFLHVLDPSQRMDARFTFQTLLNKEKTLGTEKRLLVPKWKQWTSKQTRGKGEK